MSSASFRPDVEGLRAVAIGAVLLSHAGVGAAAGGFAGVDVFFVISGFLITQVLTAELRATGSVSLVAFYARRVKRLMPQAIAAMAAVAGASALLLSPLESGEVASDVIASAVYGMNWRLSAESVDYFAAAQDRPLDHFWSLAVEEQFYVVWPLLLIAVAWCRRALPLVLAAIVVASLAYAAHVVQVAPEQAYFSPLARAWELALGGVLATLGDLRLGRRAATVSAWAGAGAIAGATLAFRPSTGFPGVPALVPTLGTVALLAAGAGTLPTRALSLRPVRYVGRISYALYVWHWPVLVFAAHALGPLSPGEGVIVVLASVVPAVLTHRWIEEPMRRSKIHLRRPRLTVAAALAGPVVAAIAAVALTSGLSSAPALSASQAEGAPQLARTRALQGSAHALRPRVRDADRDRGRSYADGCLVAERATRSPACAYGDRRSRTTVVLFGDSHAMQYFPALERIARRRHWRLVQLAKAGCPPSGVRVVFTISDRSYAECDVWRDYALRRIERTERPALVVVAASARYTIVRDGSRLAADDSLAALTDGFGPVVTRLRSAARHVVVLQDSPRPPLDVPACVSASMQRLRRCAFDRAASTVRAQTAIAGARRIRGIRVIDPTDRYCLRSLCPAVIGDVLVYRNSGHVTASYVETLAPWLGRRLDRVLRPQD